jgi:hypothetical protein
MEARIQGQVVRSIEADLVPVMENFQYLQKRTAYLYRASLGDGGRQ